VNGPETGSLWQPSRQAKNLSRLGERVHGFAGTRCCVLSLAGLLGFL